MLWPIKTTAMLVGNVLLIYTKKEDIFTSFDGKGMMYFTLQFFKFDIKKAEESGGMKIRL